MAVTRYPTVAFKVNFEDDPLAPYDEYIQALGPLGYWRLNESAGTNADDSSPNNRDGTYTGGFTLSQTGALVPYGDSDNAVSFNGTTGYIDFASSSTWRNLFTGWTLSAWIYPTATRQADSDDVAGIFEVGSAALNHTPLMMRYGRVDAAGSTGSYVWAGWHTTTGGNYRVAVDALSAPPLNTYTHYIATYDGTVVRIYRNFELVAQNTAASGNAAAESDVPLRIGRQVQTGGSGTDAFFPGRIDEPFVLDYAMSPAAIAKLQGSLSAPADKSANFVDLSTRIRSVSFRAGRQDNVNRVEAADATVVLDNRDGALLPDPIVNLLPNPSFEEDQPYIPFRVVGGTKSRDTTHVQVGTYAAKFTGGASATTAYLTSAQGGLTAMRPGKTYTFSAYVYLPSATGVDLADVTLEIVDEVAGSAASTVSSAPGSFNTFVRLSVTRTIRSNADASYCRVAFVTDVGGDSIWVDAVQLEEAASASTYADGDQTDCRWNGEPHLSLTHRKVAGSYRNIMPGRLAMLQATWNSVTYGLLRGYVDSFAYSYPGRADAVVTLRLTDGFRPLSQQSMLGFGRPAEGVGSRVRAILRAAGVPEAEIDVDDSYIDTSTIAAVTVTSDTSARALISDCEDTEKGLFFISGDGMHTYQGSQYRSVGNVESFVLTDDDTQIPYTDIAANLDMQNVRNVVSVSNEASGNVHAFIQPASVRRFFPVTASETSKWALDIASYVDHSEPYPFADGIQVKPASNPSVLWPQILGLTIGDLGRIQRIRQGRDLFAGFLQYLEGYSHEIASRQGPWDVTLRTTPVVQSPIPISSWNSPISVPAMLTANSSHSSAASYTTASSTYTSGRLYVLFVSAKRDATPSPATPTFTSTYTWTQIRSDAVTFGSRFGRWGSFYTVAGSTVTEALVINFATNNPSFCEWVIFEIASGFDATPIGSSAFGNSSASTMQTDVGTLLDSQSIVLANGFKDNGGVISPIWPVFTSVFTDGASPATTAAFGAPGLDTAVIQWGTGEAGFCEVVEIDAA